MKKIIVILLTLSALLLCFRMMGFGQEIIWENISREILDLKTVLVSMDNPHIIYVGSRSAVLKTEDAGESWRSILSIRGQNRGVNYLTFDAQHKNYLYAATENGLFYSPDAGRHWQRIFKGKNYLENECTILVILPCGIYLGTKAGLFVSKDRGRAWQRETAKLGKSNVLAIAYHIKEPDYIYVACVDGVFKSKDAGVSWERIFVAHAVENGDDKDETNEDRDEEERFSEIQYVCVDPNNANYLYIATSNGVYASKDKGKTWDAMTDYGLLNRDIKLILISRKSNTYVVTKSGVFEYKDERWYELSLGLIADDIRFLAEDSSGGLYAACDNGLFKANLKNSVNDTPSNIVLLYSKDEPSINEIQNAAIKYAEVEPGKIKEWRKKAKMKAILPKLTVGLDRSQSTNYEIYTSATTRYVYDGPDDSSSGWDVTLSWDLGDLLWNNDQTSIDVRSRLMVQLRDDILDEVTKIYFERLRVKMELDELSIEDRKKRLEKELRLQELTASLDALTGGYFSKSITK